MIKYICKNNLIFLIFLNLLLKEKINFLYINLDFLKKKSEISDYYKNLIDIFSKKKAQILSFHQNHLNHHIFLIDNIQSIFNSIYNFSKMEFKVFKKYIKEKLIKR